MIAESAPIGLKFTDTIPVPATNGRNPEMAGIQHILEVVRDQGLAKGRLRGLFHLLIGRKLTAPDGTLLSVGVTWRELSLLLKQLKYDRELVRELGEDPDTLSPKDRERFWYFAIAHAKVDSVEARTQADELAKLLAPLGILASVAPGTTPKPPAKPTLKPVVSDDNETDDTPKAKQTAKKPRKKK